MGPACKNKLKSTKILNKEFTNKTDAVITRKNNLWISISEEG